MRAKGHSVDNIVEGVMRVAVPATFGVLTTIAAFLPILMVEGIMGEFFKAIGVVVMLAANLVVLPALVALRGPETEARAGSQPVGAEHPR